MLQEGTLIPQGIVYPNGYGFQALALSLIQFSGLSLAELQMYASRLMMVWLIIPAWLLYREFTGSNRGAALATMILLLQPEFLFVVLRGTHEKFSRGLMLVCLFLLLRSIHSGKDKARFVAFVLAFYLAGYALISLNNLLATSFIVAVVLALALIWLLGYRMGIISGNILPIIKRLMMITLSLIVIAFVFNFYIYPPAQHDLQVLEGVSERLSRLFLQVEGTASNPYTVVATGWISLPVYFLVSLANWILLLFSASIWTYWTVTMWLLGQQRPSLRRLLLWAFYGAFALQGALSVAVDVSGAIASNLQHRIFPSFAMLAAPVLAQWLDELGSVNLKKKRMGISLFAAIIGILAILSVFKATNEPLLSNKWQFYSQAEDRAIHWFENSKEKSSLWTDHDERLFAGIGINYIDTDLWANLDTYAVNPSTRDYLVSTLNRARSLRLKQPLPIEMDTLVTYDNGEAQIYHARPHTPYQR